MNNVYDGALNHMIDLLYVSDYDANGSASPKTHINMAVLAEQCITAGLYRLAERRFEDACHNNPHLLQKSVEDMYNEIISIFARLRKILCRALQEHLPVLLLDPDFKQLFDRTL